MKLEIKSITPKSAYKTVLYLMLPICILPMIFGIPMLFSNDDMLKLMGFMYVIGVPLLVMIVYGPLAMLSTSIYSLMAKRLGGLVITVDEIKSEDAARNNTNPYLTEQKF